MWPALLASGAIVGLSLGLTGGGGALFAVPLLVYGLGVAPAEAVAISLVAVGATAAVGFFAHWRRGQVETSTGLLFAGAGMAGAPLGAWLGRLVPDSLLLALFALLMLVAAVRLWRKAEGTLLPAEPAAAAPACRRDPAGRLLLSSRCAALLLGLGAASGALAGLFGVGGGFVIVPALVIFSGMSIRLAIGTSLLAIALVSAAAVAARWLGGQAFDAATIALFAAGGVAGMLAGTRLGRSLPERLLQRSFAVAIAAVAALVVVKSLA